MLNNVKELNKGLRMQIDDGKIFLSLEQRSFLNREKKSKKYSAYLSAIAQSFNRSLFPIQ